MTPIIWHSGLEKAMMERVKRLISTGFGDEELAHQDFQGSKTILCDVIMYLSKFRMHNTKGEP